MKKVPTRKQFDKFMDIFEREAGKELIVGEYVDSSQIEAVRRYGSFLALVPEDKYKFVANNFSSKIKLYELANQNVLYHSLKHHEVNDKKKVLLHKARNFRKELFPPFSKPRNQKEERYKQFIELFDMYIRDLQSDPYEGGMGDTGDHQIIPSFQFAKPAKKSKTELKKYLDDILEKYKIKGYSQNVQNLITALKEVKKK